MIVRRAVRRSVRLALAPARVRRLVESELARRRGLDAARSPAKSASAAAGPPASAEPERRFTDRHGTVHRLDPTLRNRLKPSWRVMCDPVAVAAPPTDDALRARAKKARSVVAEARKLVEAASGRPLTGRILEIGSYDGASSFALATDPATSVVGSDLARYYVVQRPGEPTEAEIDAQQVALATLRERARAIAGIDPGRVAFVEDDITASSLEAGSFDAIVSFEVLEHLARPTDGFVAMARLLRPGGVVYHDYNPFFAVNGGHSLVTLDMPWGHARLDDADVQRYLREVRPAEVDQALRFYRENLNRMTMADLRAAVDAAGLELLALVPWSQRSLVADLAPAVLADVQRVYPGVSLEDLLATFVAVIARRPVSGR